MKIPTVSVLMPVYNAERYLEEAIESILNQTFRDFEFLIINDGSTDRSEEIILSYTDDRIRYIKNPDNIGVIASLNKGIQLSTGKYLARMDADDISCKDRFQEQVKYLEDNSQIGLCGCNYRKFGNNFRSGMVRHYPDDIYIRAQLLFNSPMAHPSVMMRSKVIRENLFFYDSNYISAEDYELWWRLSSKTKMGNIQKVLLLYRVHNEQVTEKHMHQQRNHSDKLREIMLIYYKIIFNKEQLLIHNQFCNIGCFNNLSEFADAEKWLKYLLNENKRKQFIQHKALAEIIHARWISHIYNSSIGVFGAIRFLISPLTWIKGKNLIEVVKVAFKCV